MNESRKPLLIVEDDPALQKQMQWAFDKYETIVAGDRESAIAQLRRYEPAVVTMDLGLPPHPDDPTEGLHLLDEIHTIAPDTKVIVLTGQNDQQNALKAIALGAHDFCPKPFEPEFLTWTIDQAFRVHDLQEENRRLLISQHPSELSGIITRDPDMLRICRTIEKLAPTFATVLILGESGTGKELVARALHDLSPRRGLRFVAINCAAIPENLLESELFGYERGAFTGAAKQTLGKIETAHRGTLFLDEIGDLPISLQSKLLRFLQERVIERVGGRQEIPVDVRIVCATHQILKDQIVAGKFREDLYYRLAEIVVEIPAIALPQGRRRPPRARLRRKSRRRTAPQFDDAKLRCAECDRCVRLARQRARARERNQARGHHGRHLDDHGCRHRHCARQRRNGRAQPSADPGRCREDSGPPGAEPGQWKSEQGGRNAGDQPSHAI